MTSGRVVAVVPIKELNRSKSRLSDRLSSEERSSLSMGLLARVILAVAHSEACAIWIVGRDGCAEDTAGRLGATWLQDEWSDLNGAVNGAFRKAYDVGLTPMYLPGDLPFISPDDVRRIIEMSDDGSELTLSQARRDKGTNAVLAPDQSRFQVMLSTGSFRKHREQATGHGGPVAFFDSPGLGLDVDVVEDLEIVDSITPGLISQLTNR